MGRGVTMDPLKITDAVVRAVSPILARQKAAIQALERRLADVEARSMKLRGAWQRALQYD